MPRNEVEGLLELKSNTGRSCTAHAMGTADSMLHAARISAARTRKTPEPKPWGWVGRLSRFLNIW